MGHGQPIRCIISLHMILSKNGINCTVVLRRMQTTINVLNQNVGKCNLICSMDARMGNGSLNWKALTKDKHRHLRLPLKDNSQVH